MAITKDFLKEELNKVNSDFTVSKSSSGVMPSYVSKYESLFTPVSSDFVKDITTARKPLSTGTYAQTANYVPSTVSQKATEEQPSAFAGFGKAFVGGLSKGFVEYTAAAIDYLIKAGEDTKKGITKQVPAMIQDYLYNKSDDPAIQSIIDKYEAKEAADSLPFLQRTVEKAKINIERARETTKYQHIGEVESSLGMGGQFRMQNTQYYRNIMNSLSKYQDLESAGAVSQFAAGLVGSVPYTVAGSVPFGVGFLFNFGTQSQNNIRQKYDELKKAGGKLTAEDADNIYLYSMGSAYLDSLVEQLTGFGVSKLYGTIFKKAGKLPVKTAFGYVTKEILKSGGGESLEEYISGLGQAVIAKITTDPDKTILTLTEEEGGLASLEGLTKNAAGAFIMGSVMEFVNTKSHVNTWNGTKAALRLVEDKISDEITPDDVLSVDDAIKEDSLIEENMDELKVVASQTIKDILETDGMIDKDYAAELIQQQEMPTMPAKAPASPAEPSQAQGGNIPLSQAQAATAGAGAVAAMSELQTKSASFTKEMKPTMIAGYEVSYNAKQARAASINVDTNKITLGRAFFKEGVTAEKKQQIIAHEIAHTMLKRAGITGANLVATELFGKNGAVNSEEFMTHAMSNLLVNPNYVSEHPKMADSIKRRYAYAQEVINKANQVKQVAQAKEKPVESPKEQSKQSQTQVEEVSKAIAETPDATDTGTRQGIVAPGFTGQPQSTKQAQETQGDRWNRSKATIESMKKTSNFDHGKGGFKGFLRDVKDFIRTNFLQDSVTVSMKHGDYRQAIRLSRLAGSNAATMATELIKKSYGIVNAEQIELLKNAIIYFDIIENAKGGQYKKVPLPHGIKSIDEAIATAKLLREDMLKPENELVVKAFKTRKRLMNVVRDNLIAAGAKVGVDYSYVKKREYYVYNAVYEIYMMQNRGKLYRNKLKYLPRQGSAHDYISNPVVCDYLILSKMIRDTYRLNVLKTIQDMDISSTVTFDSKGNPIIKEGYVLVGKNEIIGHVDTTSLLFKNAYKEAVKVLEEEGISQDSPEGKAILETAHGYQIANSMVIPIEVFQNVQTEFMPKEKVMFERFERKIMRIWKFTKIRTPFKAWKYNVRNAIGDLDAVVAGDPGSLTYIPRAIHELFLYYYKGNRESAMLLKFMEKTGGMSGEAIREMGDIENHPNLSFLKGSATPKQMSAEAIKKIWGALTLEKFTNFREQILRYAVYMHQSKQLQKNGGKIKYYMASSRTEIRSLTNNDDKAVRLAVDLVGAYDNVSPTGAWIADHLVPFFRFKEVNIKRYVRMVVNAFYSDGSVINKEGMSFAQKAGIAARVGSVATMRLGKLAIKLGLFYGAIALMNNLFNPDEEDKLTDDIKRQPHIIFPSWMFGGDKARIYYLTNIGSFSDLLGSASIDYEMAGIIQSVVSGKMTPGEAADKIATHSLSRVVFSISPELLNLVELSTGKKGYYFDAENPTVIRDKLQYLAEQAGFAPIYDWLSGKPQSKATSTDTIVANSAASGDMAMWQVYDMMEDWYAENDKSPYKFGGYEKGTTAYDRSLAAYYFKVSVKLKDTAAMQKYLDEYIALGGTEKTMKASLRTMMPGFNMEKNDKAAFLAQLTPEEKATYERAEKWYDEIYNLANDYAMPKLD